MNYFRLFNCKNMYNLRTFVCYAEHRSMSCLDLPFRCYSKISNHPKQRNSSCSFSVLTSSLHNLSSSEMNNTPDSDSSDFIMFYKFPYILHFRMFNRLKIYQSFITAFLVPPMWIGYFTSDMIPLSTATFVSGMSCFALLMLFVIGNISQRIIGRMYLNRSRNMVRVAHLTFWGHRSDFHVSVDEIVPSSGVGILENDIATKFKMFHDERTFYYPVKYGEIINEQMFESVFGPIEDLKNYKKM